MVARIFMLCSILLAGCANKTIQSQMSAADPANPNAPESMFSPRPDILKAGMPISSDQPVTEPTSPSHLPATLSTTYTCPMHAEVVQQSEGKCPKCGMRLVPAEPSKTDPEGKQ